MSISIDYTLILQWATFCATVFMILSGVPPSYEVYKTKNATKAPVLFFLFSIANGIGWLHYGYLIGNFNLVSLNSVAVALNTVYVLLYLAYSSDWTSFNYKFTALLAYFSALYYHLYYVSAGDAFLKHLGASASLVNILFMLLPLLDIFRMLSTGDSTGTHLSILTAGILCSGLWSLYGQAINDFNVVLPNLIGVVCATAGLIVRLYVGGSASKAARGSRQQPPSSGSRGGSARRVKKDN